MKTKKSNRFQEKKVIKHRRSKRKYSGGNDSNTKWGPYKTKVINNIKNIYDNEDAKIPLEKIKTALFSIKNGEYKNEPFRKNTTIREIINAFPEVKLKNAWVTGRYRVQTSVLLKIKHTKYRVLNLLGNQKSSSENKEGGKLMEGGIGLNYSKQVDFRNEVHLLKEMAIHVGKSREEREKRKNELKMFSKERITIFEGIYRMFDSKEVKGLKDQKHELISIVKYYGNYISFLRLIASKNKIDKELAQKIDELEKNVRELIELYTKHFYLLYGEIAVDKKIKYDKSKIINNINETNDEVNKNRDKIEGNSTYKGAIQNLKTAIGNTNRTIIPIVSDPETFGKIIDDALGTKLFSELDIGNVDDIKVEEVNYSKGRKRFRDVFVKTFDKMIDYTKKKLLREIEKREMQRDNFQSDNLGVIQSIKNNISDLDVSCNLVNFNPTKLNDSINGKNGKNITVKQILEYFKDNYRKNIALFSRIIVLIKSIGDTGYKKGGKPAIFSHPFTRFVEHYLKGLSRLISLFEEINLDQPNFKYTQLDDRTKMLIRTFANRAAQSDYKYTNGKLIHNKNFMKDRFHNSINKLIDKVNTLKSTQSSVVPELLKKIKEKYKENYCIIRFEFFIDRTMYHIDTYGSDISRFNVHEKYSNTEIDTWRRIWNQDISTVEQAIEAKLSSKTDAAKNIGQDKVTDSDNLEIIFSAIETEVSNVFKEREFRGFVELTKFQKNYITNVQNLLKVIDYHVDNLIKLLTKDFNGDLMERFVNSELTKTTMGLIPDEFPENNTAKMIHINKSMTYIVEKKETEFIKYYSEKTDFDTTLCTIIQFSWFATIKNIINMFKKNNKLDDLLGKLTNCDNKYVKKIIFADVENVGFTHDLLKLINFGNANLQYLLTPEIIELMDDKTLQKYALPAFKKINKLEDKIEEEKQGGGGDSDDDSVSSVSSDSSRSYSSSVSSERSASNVSNLSPKTAEGAEAKGAEAKGAEAKGAEAEGAEAEGEVKGAEAEGEVKGAEGEAKYNSDSDSSIEQKADKPQEEESDNDSTLSASSKKSEKEEEKGQPKKNENNDVPSSINYRIWSIMTKEDMDNYLNNRENVEQILNILFGASDNSIQEIQDADKPVAKQPVVGGAADAEYTFRTALNNIFGTESTKGLDGKPLEGVSDSALILILLDIKKNDRINKLLVTLNDTIANRIAIGRIRGILKEDEDNLNIILKSNKIEGIDITPEDLEVDDLTEETAKILNTYHGIPPKIPSGEESNEVGAKKENSAESNAKALDEQAEEINKLEVKYQGQLYQIITKENKEEKENENKEEEEEEEEEEENFDGNDVLDLYNELKKEVNEKNKENEENKTNKSQLNEKVIADRLVRFIVSEDFENYAKITDANVNIPKLEKKRRLVAELLTKLNTSLFIDPHISSLVNLFWPDVGNQQKSQNPSKVIKKTTTFQSRFYPTVYLKEKDKDGNEIKKPKTYSHNTMTQTQEIDKDALVLDYTGVESLFNILLNTGDNLDWGKDTTGDDAYKPQRSEEYKQEEYIDTSNLYAWPKKNKENTGENTEETPIASATVIDKNKNST